MDSFFLTTYLNVRKHTKQGFVSKVIFCFMRAVGTKQHEARLDHVHKRRSPQGQPTYWSIVELTL